jgi:ATP-dependent protease ClpP protease subunit
MLSYIFTKCRYVKVPIFTLCIGNAWGEAALLLAAGAKGNRAALPSSTIMMKQVISVPFVDRDKILISILDDHTVNQYLDDDS